jgi:ectoine hydroxylase-related dioxygenase (phytanoyl-CoA dioxygenase family)
MTNEDEQGAAMKTELTAEQVTFYQTNGYLLVEDFLNEVELEAWRTAVDEAVHERLTARTADFEKDLNNQGNPDNYYAQVFTQCIRLADTHEGMAKLMLDERLGKVTGTLAGVDGIRIWHDQALIKPPYGNATAWHLDNPYPEEITPALHYWSFSSANAISIWVALDDATLENGCMWYLPGTHKTAKYVQGGIGSSMRDLFKSYPEWLTIQAVAAPAKAGSAVFHSGLTAHAAGANMTPRPRRAMTCAYMPDGSTFNGQKNILSAVYYESLKVGDVLDDDRQNPLIWRR